MQNTKHPTDIFTQAETIFISLSSIFITIFISNVILLLAMLFLLLEMLVENPHKKSAKAASGPRYF